MNYFIFKVGVKNDIEVKTYNPIAESDIEYIEYNKFLNKKYSTNIEENDDYIPMNKKNEALMILRTDQFKQTELEDVFEIIHDSLYYNEGDNVYEKSVNY